MGTEAAESETEVLRLFIGMRPDARSQRFFDALVERCRQLTEPNKWNQTHWISHSNRHLTLAFLGDTPMRLIAPMQERLARIAATLPPCSGQLVSLHPFPRRRSRLLAAELLGNPALNELHRQCRQLMLDLGMTPESAAYRPHVTLARSRRGFAQLEPLPLDYTLPLENLILYQSHTAPGGSQYLPLFEARLTGG